MFKHPVYTIISQVLNEHATMLEQKIESKEGGREREKGG